MSARQSSSKPASTAELAKKSTVSKKSVTAAVEAVVAPVSAPAPVVVAPAPAVPVVVAPAPSSVQVDAPASKAPKVARSRAKAVVSAPVAVPEAVVVEAAPVVQEAASVPAEVVTSDESGEQAAVKARRQRARPRNRAFTELHTEMSNDLTSAYKSLQNVVRGFTSLANAHKREVSSTVHREVSSRTPSALFDPRLVAYFMSRIPADQMKITRKNGESVTTVDLSTMTPSTPMFRTDVTKLYTTAFRLNNLTASNDHRTILYQNDPDLVALLTTGNYNHEHEAEIQMIRDGTFKLDIFNIQRFLGYLVGKAPAAQAHAQSHAEVADMPAGEA